jgi:hypothetical protein
MTGWSPAIRRKTRLKPGLQRCIHYLVCGGFWAGLVTIIAGHAPQPTSRPLAVVRQ